MLCWGESLSHYYMCPICSHCQVYMYVYGPHAGIKLVLIPSQVICISLLSFTNSLDAFLTFVMYSYVCTWGKNNYCGEKVTVNVFLYSHTDHTQVTLTTNNCRASTKIDQEMPSIAMCVYILPLLLLLYSAFHYNTRIYDRPRLRCMYCPPHSHYKALGVTKGGGAKLCLLMSYSGQKLCMDHPWKHNSDGLLKLQGLFIMWVCIFQKYSKLNLTFACGEIAPFAWKLVLAAKLYIVTQIPHPPYFPPSPTATRKNLPLKKDQT